MMVGEVVTAVMMTPETVKVLVMVVMVTEVLNEAVGSCDGDAVVEMVMKKVKEEMNRLTVVLIVT